MDKVTVLAVREAVRRVQAGTAGPLWLQEMEHTAEHGNPLRYAILRAARVRAQRPMLASGGGYTAPSDDAIERELDELRALVTPGVDLETALAAWFDAAADWPEVPGWPAGLDTLQADYERYERYLYELRTSPALAPWRARTGWIDSDDEKQEQE